MTTVQDFLNILDNFAPVNLAEPWDNVGLLIGSPRNKVNSVLLGLDPCRTLIEEAKSLGAELIITHHPAIFHPLKALRTDRPDGDFIRQALGAGINVIAAHTNLDACTGGVSEVLARLLGIDTMEPLIPGTSCDSQCGLGRIGNLSAAITAERFLKNLHEALQPPWLMEAGPRPATVRRIAVCGGSCSDFAEAALAAGADIFLTAEIKHATARWAEDAHLWLIDGGHFATENPIVKALGRHLTEHIAKTKLDVMVYCANQPPPLQLINV